jgi:hypothetical protein
MALAITLIIVGALAVLIGVIGWRAMDYQLHPYERIHDATSRARRDLHRAAFKAVEEISRVQVERGGNGRTSLRRPRR